MDFGFWTTGDVTKLGASIITSNVGSLNGKLPEYNLQLFKRDVLFRVLHALMDFSVTSVVSSDSGVAEETSATLAGLDSFLATTVTCLRADGSEEVCGHSQKLYRNTFPSFLLIAFAQHTQKIGAYV